MTAGRAVGVFLLLLVVLLGGSVLSALFLSSGWSLWLNQAVIIGAAAILAWKNKWSWREVFRFRGTNVRAAVAAFFLGVSLWWSGIALNIWSERMLNSLLGPLNVDIPFAFMDIIMVPLALVVLAPFCEEILFRGYFLRAFEAETWKPWLWSGLLFGVLHIANGLGAWLSPLIWGIVLGYIVWKTESIVVGMLAHAGVNLTALFFGWYFQASVTAPSFSPLLLILSLMGLVLAVLFISVLTKTGASPGPDRPEPTGIKFRWLQWAALGVTCLILFGLGAVDAAARIMAPVQINSVTLTEENIDGELGVVEIAVTNTPATLEFRYKLSSADIDATLMVLAPDGTLIWSREYKGEGLSLESAAPNQVALDTRGNWQIVLKGTGTETDLSFFWLIK